MVSSLKASSFRAADVVVLQLEVPIDTVIFRNVGLRGGVAPARKYIPELLPDVLAGRINPGRVLDFETDLEGIAEAYAAMDERRSIKSLVRVADQ